MVFLLWEGRRIDNVRAKILFEYTKLSFILFTFILKKEACNADIPTKGVIYSMALKGAEREGDFLDNFNIFLLFENDCIKTRFKMLFHLK
jgi:hypothetical protein